VPGHRRLEGAAQAISESIELMEPILGR